jgi:hypothetical protein
MQATQSSLKLESRRLHQPELDSPVSEVRYTTEEQHASLLPTLGQLNE